MRLCELASSLVRYKKGGESQSAPIVEAMVLRTDLLNTIGVIAALLLPLTTEEDSVIRTQPMAIGVCMKCLSNVSYFANLYSLLATLTASYWAVKYEVYGDVRRPIIGLVIAFITLLCDNLLGVIIECFDMVDRDEEDAYAQYKTYRPPWSVWMFLVWVVPFAITILATVEIIIGQRMDSYQHRLERDAEGLPLVDPEKRRPGDAFSWNNRSSTKTMYIRARR